MMKFNRLCILLCSLLFGTALLAQTKQEREYRISKEEFPHTALTLLQPYLDGVKRLRFYKETDGAKSSYEAKFKKDKLHYSIEFDTNGQLEDVEFLIKPTDIPDDALAKLHGHLKSSYQKYRIKKIQQQYLLSAKEPAALLKTAFQNLLIPSLNYELIVAAKNSKGYHNYEITFTADGLHRNTRKSINANYDHVLYQ